MGRGWHRSVGDLEMSDYADFCRDMKDYKKQKKEQNEKFYFRACDILDREKISYRTIERDHMVVKEHIDYNPVSGKWEEQGTGTFDYGIKSLLKHIKKGI